MLNKISQQEYIQQLLTDDKVLKHADYLCDSLISTFAQNFKMKKLSTLLAFALLLSMFLSKTSTAQNWTVGVPVDMVITSNLFHSNFCFPTADQHFTVDGSITTGVNYYLYVDSVSPDSVYIMPGMDTLAVGDSIFLPSGGNLFSLYFFHGGGLLNMSVKAKGIPTVAFDEHPCQPNNLWMSNLMICDEGLSPIISNNCQVQPANFGVTGSSTNSTCFSSCNGTATANVLGATQPISYLWSNGETTQSLSNLCSGTYTVTVTDGGGNSGTASSVVTSPAEIIVNATVTSATCASCPNGSATITTSGGVGSLNITWSNGETGYTIDSLFSGEYIATITDSIGCSVFDTVTVGIGESVNNIFENNQLSIYPNPAYNQLTVYINQSAVNYFELKDLLGRTILIQQFEKGKSQFAVDVSAIPASVYFISIHTIDGNIFVKQFMKN